MYYDYYFSTAVHTRRQEIDEQAALYTGALAEPTEKPKWLIFMISARRFLKKRDWLDERLMQWRQAGKQTVCQRRI